MLHCHQLGAGIINLLAGDLNLAGPGCYGIEIKGKCKGTRSGRARIPMDPDRVLEYIAKRGEA